MKKITILLIALVVISVGFLSGCTNVENSYPDEENNGDDFIPTGDVEIINYSVETQLLRDGISTIESGFIHNDDTLQFNITGTVKNNVGKTVSRIIITAKFYDGNNTYLREEKKSIYNLANSASDDFEFNYYRWIKYFEIVEKVEFELDYEL